MKKFIGEFFGKSTINIGNGRVGVGKPIFTKETDKKAKEIISKLSQHNESDTKSCSTLQEAYNNPQFVKGMSHILSEAANNLVDHFNDPIYEKNENKGIKENYQKDIEEYDILQNPIYWTENILPQIINMEGNQIALPKDVYSTTVRILQATFGSYMESTSGHNIGKEAQGTALRTLELLFKGKEIPNIFKDKSGEITLENIRNQLDEKLRNMQNIDSTGYTFDVTKKDYFNSEGESLLTKVATIKNLRKTIVEDKQRHDKEHADTVDQLEAQIKEIGVMF